LALQFGGDGKEFIAHIITSIPATKLILKRIARPFGFWHHLIRNSTKGGG
jgi:hypothetical protein